MHNVLRKFYIKKCKLAASRIVPSESFPLFLYARATQKGHREEAIE